MAHPAAQIPPQFVFKASVSKLDVIVSSAPTGALISVACVVETVRPARKYQALWSVPGKHLTAYLVLHDCRVFVTCMSK